MTVGRRADFAAAAALCLVPFLLLAGALHPAHGLADADWTNLDYPFYVFARDVFAAEGRLPLWNPHIFSGLPFLTSLNTHVFYPTELLSLPFHMEPATFFAADAILHLGWAGLGMYALLRSAGRLPAAAFTGALCFQLGQHFCGLVSIGIPWLRDLAWMPWLFLGLERIRAGENLRWAVLAGVALGLPVLTAGVQYALFVSPAVAAWLILAAPGRAPLRLAACFGTALAVSAAVWLPAAEYAARSVRAYPGLAAAPLATQWATTPADLAALLVPELFGWRDVYYGPHPLVPSPDYFGLLPLLLAAAGGAAAWRKDARFAWLGAAGVVLALGPATPAGALLSRLPVYAGFRGAARWLGLTHLAVAWFAARGWEALAADRRRALRLAALPLAFAAACLGARGAGDAVAARLARLPFVRGHLERHELDAAGVRSAVDAAFTRSARAGMLAAAALGAAGTAVIPLPAAAAATWLVTGADLRATWLRHVRFAPPRAADGVELALGRLTRGRQPPARVTTDEWLMLPNRRMASGLHWIFGYHGVPPGRSVMLKLLATTPPPLGQPRTLALLDVGYAVGGVPAGWTRLGTAPGEDGVPVALARPPHPGARAFLAAEAVPCADERDALAVLRAPGWTPARAALEPWHATPPAGTFSTRGHVELRWGRDALAADVRAAGRALVVFAETWDPAWQAFVDGARVPVWRADVGLRAVEVPAGAHTVTMRYESWRLKAGILLSLLAAAALPGLVLALRP